MPKLSDMAEMEDEEREEYAGGEVKPVPKKKSAPNPVQEPGPRAVIIGEIDGYQTHIPVYGKDLVEVAEGEDMFPFEPGILHAVVAQLKEQGLKPYWAKNRESSSGGNSSTRSSGGSSKKKQTGNEDWECPAHGKEYVNTDFLAAKRGETVYMCKYFEPAEDEDGDFTVRPKWGKINEKTQQPFKTNGEYRWYCKHTELD